MKRARQALALALAIPTAVQETTLNTAGLKLLRGRRAAFHPQSAFALPDRSNLAKRSAWSKNDRTRTQQAAYGFKPDRLLIYCYA